MSSSKRTGTTSSRLPERLRWRTRRIGSQEYETGASLLAQGESMVWLTGGALAMCLCMILGVVGLIVVRGLPAFWPGPIVLVETKAGKKFAGEITGVERLKQGERETRRRLFRIENFEITNEHFTWIPDDEIVNESQPPEFAVFERQEADRFYGEPIAIFVEGKRKECSPAESWDYLQREHSPARSVWEQRRRLEEHEIGAVDTKVEASRLAIRAAELRAGPDSDRVKAAREEFVRTTEWSRGETERLRGEIQRLREQNSGRALVARSAGGEEITIPLEGIVRVSRPNQLSFSGKLGLFLSRWWEFLTAEPRNVNTEGGVFPAIWGTVAMTLIMSLAVAPFGVLAALYLREYAKGGVIVSLVRIALNNLAGVPSIVFGVFGLGFFCYQIGAFIDGGPQHADFPVMPAPIWFLTLGALAVCGLAAFLGGIYGSSARAAEMSSWKQRLRFVSAGLWVVFTVLFLVTLFTSPFFHGFFAPSLPNPTFGKGGILWAALTLALLTLPVVIVATEEALAAVPNSMREGSYACGAGKWQTIRRIVLPQAMPGIMTGLILAMSRGAGEAAPLMLVGALKFAPKLPVDGEFPFVHADRPFMHLAFHVYDLAFHSPNAEAAKPTAYATALLLITIVALLNVTAVTLRTRLRKAYRPGQF